MVTQEDPTQINDIREDVMGECEKFGTVKKIIIYDVSSDGLCYCCSVVYTTETP